MQTIKNAQLSRKSFVVGSLNILLGHFQIMPLLKKINFDWEKYVYSFLNFQAFVGNSAEAVNSIDCLIISKLFIY